MHTSTPTVSGPVQLAVLTARSVRIEEAVARARDTAADPTARRATVPRQLHLAAAG